MVESIEEAALGALRIASEDLSELGSLGVAIRNGVDLAAEDPTLLSEDSLGVAGAVSNPGDNLPIMFM